MLAFVYKLHLMTSWQSNKVSDEGKVSVGRECHKSFRLGAGAIVQR